MVSTLSFRSVSALIVEHMKHIHAVHPSVILSFLRPFQIPTKSFQAAAAFYSTLKTPFPPPPSFESTPVASFLLNDCGFSLNQANSICTRKRDLLAKKSYDNSRETLRFLRDKGFDEVGVRKLFFKFPGMLGFSFQGTIKPKVEFLEKIGLTGQKLLKVLRSHPYIFGLSISHTMERKICFLKSVLDPEPVAVVSTPKSDKITGKVDSNHSLTLYVLHGNPRIMSSSIAKMLGFVKDVEGMGIDKGSKAFARSFVVFSMLKRDTVERKLENLKELGFTEQEVGILVKKFPMLLGLTEYKVRQNLKFLLEEWKLPRNVILSCPAALGYSTENRLKPRFNALKALTRKNKSSKTAESYPPWSYLIMSEKDFRRKVVSRLPVATEENEEASPS